MNNKLLFSVLILIVGISGFSQGMLLPIIAIIFENDGISSSLNGFHAASLYIGILLISPFMEAPLRKYGYKPLIVFGGITVILSLALFPVWKSFWFWFVLRFFIGIGDHTLHFATQTWITAISPKTKRGRNLAIYGLFFSLGFMVGPLMTKLLEINQSLPFIITSILSLLAWSAVFLIGNELPEQDDSESTSFLGTLKRFTKVSRIAWVAFLLPFTFGVLEASLNSNFPVFALRSGIDLTAVSIIIPAFSAGTLLTQIPLGMISDRFGRRKTLLTILFSGFAIFTLAGIYSYSVLGLFICFMFGGMMVGSTFSLGISYMADLLPRNLLPAGNLLCSIFFSLGSIGGPFFGGLVIEHIQGGNFFYMISIMLFLVFISLALFKEKMPASVN
ncbi:MFS transporter [Peribacillus frigoritolerans]|jgi:MFS family permease|uniref:MFS transporter n=1 Tax=Peribacillus frigoritolerans TaxID=450367 RepID=UPI0006ABF8AE|nr:MFS transporter [Peribacillus frigoritolerans]KOR77336.1 MFS transporter [Bacillus sp. FJAT-21352]KOR84562.1 MFS transporter [Bacillus sp. FJAT-22058]MDM5304595.1 MFS transporter [Peribacillus frigoritolerans]MED4688008.1 MFS transporter [Peribacillus frigoritolerans]USK81008.1 MFS transporter [Peribacillus frigoritolerans]